MHGIALLKLHACMCSEHVYGCTYYNINVLCLINSELAYHNNIITSNLTETR